MNFKVRVTIEHTTISIGEAGSWICFATVKGFKVTVWHNEGFEQHLRFGFSDDNWTLIKINGVGRQLMPKGLSDLIDDIETAQPADMSKDSPPIYDRIVEIEVPESYLLPKAQEAT